jgi:outer membrane lipoprotein-sorting protein
MTVQHVGQVRKSGRTRVLALVGAGVIAVAGITGLVVRGAAADPVLPPLTPAELLTRVAAARVDGLSATFEQRSDLGLPTLPADLGDAGDDLTSAVALLTGTHTVRVWTAGEAKAKVALVDGSTESSITRNGNDVWAWSSTKQEAVHSTVKEPTARPSAGPTSPAEAIANLLDKLQPTTDVATSGTGYVAGRAVYQLVLTPKDDASLVSQVRVSVDAEKFVPLGLRVIADDGQDAVTLAATSVDFSVPAASVFDFTPPAGVTVTEHKADGSEPSKSGTKTATLPKTFGTGWTTVAVMDLPKSDKADEQSKVLLESLPEVSGTWGKGRLLSTSLLNAVITDDGRVAVGSVVPERLYDALAAK